MAHRRKARRPPLANVIASALDNRGLMVLTNARRVYGGLPDVEKYRARRHPPQRGIVILHGVPQWMKRVRSLTMNELGVTAFRKCIRRLAADDGLFDEFASRDAIAREHGMQNDLTDWLVEIMAQPQPRRRA